MLSKFAAFLRSPIRVGFVLLLALVVSWIPAQTASAANAYVPGSSSSLPNATTGNFGSCSFATDAVPDVTWTSRATNETVRLTGVCTAPAGSLSLADFKAAAVNHASGSATTQIRMTKNGNINNRAFKAGSYPSESGTQTIDVFTVNDCPGVADCVTYDIVIRKTQSSSDTFTDDIEVGMGFWISGFGRTMQLNTVDWLSTTRFVSSGELPIYDPPPYYFTEEYVPAAGNRCSGVQIGVQVEGDALTVADYDDVLYPRTSEAAQDDFVFVATFNDHNVITDPAGMSLEYQWPNTGWLPITEILDKIALNGGVDSAMTFRPASGELRYLSQLQFRCRDLTDGDDLTNRRHLAFWNPGPSVTTPNWTLGASYQSACRDLTLTRGAGAIQPGSTARLSYNLGGDDGLDLSVFAYGVSNFSPSTSPPIMVNSTNLLGGATGGGPPYLHYVNPGSGFLTFVLPATVDAPVDYFDLVFSCTDDIETGLIIAGSADLGLVGSTAPSGTCWSNAGMSLSSPASWITGIAKMLTCIAQDLLIPDQAALLDQVQEVNATVAERPPFVAVAAIVGFSQDLSAAFSATSGSGCFTGPAIPGVTASTQACAGAGLNIEPGQRSTMALLLTAPMILGLAGHMFGLLRGQSEYITEENGQMAMRL